MFRIHANCAVVLLIACIGLTGCAHHMFGYGSQSSSGTAPVVLAVTDTPPTMVSILSAKVILTGATLNPGSVPLFSGSTTIELTRLQTDVAYLSTTNVPAGNYTSLTLTFANPLLTIENDTATAIVSGTTTCAVGTICTIAPTTTANLAITIPLSSFSIVANSGQGLLMDVNLDNLLSATMGADFKTGTTVSAFTPAGTGAPLVGAEDVVGLVGSINAANNTFTLQNALGSFSLGMDNAATFFQFPSSACLASSFACLHANQIVSVDIGIGSTGAIVARNVVFEDADNTDTEVEGIITGTNVGQQTFNIVILAESSAVSGLSIGGTATVHYSVAPQTPFDIDFAHADNTPISTAGFIFAAPADLSVGQEVSIRRGSGSSGALINADRVRLRSTRVTANVQSIGSSNINLFSIPSIFSGHGFTQIQVQTSQFTMLSENNAPIVFTEIFPNALVSVRGPLFNVGGTPTLIATKVVLKP